MSKQYRFPNGFIGTHSEYVMAHLDEVEKIVVDDNMQGYKRVTFNRMNYDEQLVYITKLMKKQIYSVFFKNGDIYDINKSAFDSLAKIQPTKGFAFENRYDEDYKTKAKEWLNG